MSFGSPKAEVEFEVEGFLTQVKSLEIKERLLVITSEAFFTLDQMTAIRNSVKNLGGLGVIYFPDDAEVQTETIDMCISQLQEMKRKLIKPSTRGIMTDPD